LTARDLAGLVALLCAVLLAFSTGCGGAEDAQTDTAPVVTPAAPTDNAATPELPDDVDPEKLKQYVDGLRANKAAEAKKKRVLIENGGEPIELPEDFPEDLPQMPEADAVRYAASDAAGRMAVFSSDEDTEAARSFYVGKLAEEGWEILADSDLDGISLVSAVKDGRDVAVAIEDNEGAARVTIIEGKIFKGK